MTRKPDTVKRPGAAAIVPAALASAALNFWKTGRYDTFSIARILGCSEATVCALVQDKRERKVKR